MFFTRNHVALGGWRLGSCAAGETPARFREVIRAQTVAGAWAEWGELDLDDRATIGRIDDQDHWWIANLSPALAQSRSGGHRVMLEFPAIATIAEVLVNGTKVAESFSMHVPICVNITDHLTGNDELTVIIRSLTAYLDSKKWERPRWKTRLVSEQRLRNIRTALIGRVGWAPPTPVAGPYRGVTAHVLDGSEIVSCRVTASMHGDRGVIDVDVVAGPRVVVGVEVGSVATELTMVDTEGGLSRRWQASITVPTPPKWFPATHGVPALVPVNLMVSDGQAVDGVDGVDGADGAASWRVPCLPVGFRTITVDRSNDGFSVQVNGVSVFCRGAVAFPFDLVHGITEDNVIRRILRQAAAAGFNMIRTGGTGWYEQPEFHTLCDELGLLVWQDLPFASLDYPSNPEFQFLVRSELETHLPRLNDHVSTAVVCGSSEVEQQAAMMGVAPETIATTPGRTWIAALADDLAPKIPYVSSSPTGGHLPMRVDTGISHYFGVGAYQRPTSDASTSGVRFASECLAFANIPTSSVRDELGPLGSEQWKRRVPRDSGSDWDFDDVRDHYVCTRTGSDPHLRTTDPDRWQELGLVVPGDVMAETFRQWRASGGRCSGGLVLSLNDLWPSAGWGLFDSSGRMKSALARLSQVLQPVTVLALDRGLNGLDLHVFNESPLVVEGFLVVRAIDGRGRSVLRGTERVTLDPHSTTVVPAERVLGRFADPTYAYRFGARPFDAVAAVLFREPPADGTEDLGRALASALFVLEPEWSTHTDGGLSVVDIARKDDLVEVTLEASELHRFIRVEAEGMEASHGYFDLAAGQRCSVTLRPESPTVWPSTGLVQSISLAAGVPFQMPGIHRA